MKKQITYTAIALWVFAGLISQVDAQEAPENPDVIILVDKDHQEYLENLAKEEGVEIASAQELQNMQDLESALFDEERPPLNKRHEKIAEKSRMEQRRLVWLLQEMVLVDFDPLDDNASPDFNKVRSEIVELVFYAETERSYYQRLWLINQAWLDYPEELDRFVSLDRALRDRWLELEEKRKQWREIIITGSTIVGAVGGGFLSYQLSRKVIPVVANESTFRLITKWVGRGTLVVVGTYLGMSFGSYLGFLGSDMLLYKTYEFVDPIDGNEDLREILDIIEDI